MPGVTPGMRGVLVEEPRHTTLICGDAIATRCIWSKGRS